MKSQIVYAAVTVSLITSCIAMSKSDNPKIRQLKAEFVRPKEIRYLDSNKYTPERQELGKDLFFDPRLSQSNMLACVSCHSPSFGWGDSLPKGVGHGHQTLARKTPTLLNLAWTERTSWDGRTFELEQQATGPMSNPTVMNLKLDGPDGALAKLKGIQGYGPLFEKAYPGEGITQDTIGKALAMYERSLISGVAPFDAWVAGDEHAISEDAKKGFELFTGKAKCMDCHAGWAFSDGSFHDIGLKSEDIGRGKFLKMKSQQYAFKTPGLRDITLRSPYMHDGSEKTLEDVVAFYNRGGDTKRPGHAPEVQPLNLSDAEQKQIVAFLQTLTGVQNPVTFPILPR